MSFTLVHLQLKPSLSSPNQFLFFFKCLPHARSRRQVRRVFADYYTCTDVRETTESLGVFLKEAIAALELDPPPSSFADTVPPEKRLASRLKDRLLETSERLNYHLDGDDPMVLYRFWMRCAWHGRRLRVRRFLLLPS